MSNRVVFPIYDENHEYMIGCTGRSIFNECPLCRSYHPPGNRCPNDYRPSKWKHLNGFEKEKCLYNYWFSKDYIEESQTAVVVESPGNVLRLEEAGIHNAVAMFGTSFSSYQEMLLGKLLVRRVILCMDNDDAGQEAADKLTYYLSRYFTVDKITPPQNDIADCSIEEVKTLFES